MGAASITALAGGAVGAAGSLAAASAKQKAALYNANIARENARLAKQQARRDANLVREAGFKNLGAIRASVGKGGLTMEGSFSDVLSESARNIKRDELNTLFQGELQARGFEIEARQAEFGGKVAKIAGYFGAASSLLTGASNAAAFADLGPAPGGGGGGVSGGAGQGSAFGTGRSFNQLRRV